ncbi:MAG: integrase, partial [Methylomonas sp.]|nr:integrase [Methylomonas sp.]
MNHRTDDYGMYSDSMNHRDHIKPPRFRRWLVFLLVFVPCVTASQFFVFLQPAIYQSSATLLTMAATDMDQASPAADIQHVSIQRQILLGSEILEKTAERLRQITGNRKIFQVDELRSLFDVAPEAETNLVHLQAKGPDPKLLQLAIDAWIESYLKVRTAFIAENTAKVVTALDEQLQRIDKQVMDKRREIDAFRLSHNILSTESADNQAHARLQGLNASLNTALEEEVKAKAKFEAILNAISRNQTVVPEEDSRAMAVLIQQAEQLRGELAAIEGRFTKEYIDLNPNLRRVREQLAEIEAKIAEKGSYGKEYAKQEAEREYAAARQAVLSLKQQMEAHKKQ